MKQTETSVMEKIHFIKKWLEKAEHSYADDSTLKARFQILLAEAEMRNLQEKHAMFTLHDAVRLVLILAFFVLLLGVFFGIEQIKYQRPSKTGVSYETISLQTPKFEEKLWLNKSELIYRTEIQAKEVVELPQISSSEENTFDARESSEIMNSVELQETIRAAERSLRGK